MKPTKPIKNASAEDYDELFRSFWKDKHDGANLINFLLLICKLIISGAR